MAVYKIFPIKDSYISSEKPDFNYGRDEILELSTNPKSRILIQYNLNELSDIIPLISGSYIFNLKLYLSEASNLYKDYSLEFGSLSQSWDVGTGRNGDSPNPQNGASWNYADSSSYWGGGIYYDYGISQSFDYQDNKDINQDVTQIVYDWSNDILPNNGILIKFSDNDESSQLETKLSFFSSDTHTIYPPELELHWNDTIYSSSLGGINSTDSITNITNIQEEYQSDTIHTFRIKNRDKYPARQFQSSSVYLNNKILPETSYWSLKDVKTKEIIIDYNELGTKLGADDNGNYFTLYMNGLQPERYYQILIKTIINGDVIVIDNPSHHFKIVR